MAYSLSHWLRKAGLAVSGLLMGLLLAEGMARLILPPPTRQIALLRMRAPDLQMDAGTDLKKLNYNPFLQRRPFSEWICDGKTPEKMNNEGFRDHDFLIPKGTNTTRIAVLGDSFTEGWMGPRPAAFPRILQTEMGAGFEVLNFGLANRSPLRYLALYDRIVRKYHPDLVLICLYSNDVAEDEALRPYVTFDAYGIPSHFDFTRYFKNTPRMPQTKWEKRRDKWQWMLCQASRLYPYAAVTLTVDPEFRHRILEKPPDTALSRIWPNTASYLASLGELVQQDGGRYLLAYAPDQADFTVENPLRVQTRKFAVEKQIPFYDASDFLAQTNSADLYIPGDGHFSPEGHRRFAQGLSAWLQGILKPREAALPAITNAPSATGGTVRP